MVTKNEYKHRWFKIDLIVWKYTNSILIDVLKAQFKIDLIVWKFIGICNPMIIISCLK